MVRLPLSPENIIRAADGRWMWSGLDVTDHLFAWKCPNCTHSFEESMAVMTTAWDTGRTPCPDCKFSIAACSAAGCWGPSEAKWRCECGVVAQACGQHVDFFSNELSHCGPFARTTLTLLPGR